MQYITKTSRLSLFGEIITVYTGNYRTHKCTASKGQIVFDVKSGDTVDITTTVL
jgi:hypothetical protein